MIDLPVRGTFHLRAGTRLIAVGSGGVVLGEKPLRAFRVNAGALNILERCRNGLNAATVFRSEDLQQRAPVLTLFDRLSQVGLVEWRPSADDFEPFVSIVVPVYNRAYDITACLESLFALDYPASKREIIVVDDASKDATPAEVRKWNVNLIVLPSNRGQSAARNAGVAAARGEIIACIDSDCIAERSWLRDLVPYFQDTRNALVGGYVASFYRESQLDRYEEAQSPLNMGEEIVAGSGSDSDVYVPMCNTLVRRDVYRHLNGLNESLRVGEDVDLCWRLKERGFRILYVPKGRVQHKHRNRLRETYKRRFDYGTSEPVLYAAHRDVAKRFPWQHACMAVLGVCVAGLLGRQLLFIPAACLILLVDSLVKKIRYEKQLKVSLPFGTVFRATVEKHFHLLYHLCHHLVRYYLLLMLILALLFEPLIPVVAGLVLFPALAAFFRKRPRLGVPAFLFFFAAEQASYQTGVFWGCLKHWSFRPYRLTWVFASRSKSARAGRNGNPLLGNAQGTSAPSR